MDYSEAGVLTFELLQKSVFIEFWRVSKADVLILCGLCKN